MQRPIMNATHNSLPGSDDITRNELPNGIVLLTRSNFSSPSVVVSGYLRSGSRYDPDEKLGLAQFTASSLMRGTRKHTFQQIFESLESCGASLGFGASVHNTSFAGRSLIEDLPLLLDLISELLREPSFPKNQVEKLRAQMLTGLAIRNQDTADMASLVFDEIVFKGHPYARPEEGHPDTVQAITVEDLKSFHLKGYSPVGMVIVLVGALSASQALDWVGTSLGDWNPSSDNSTEPVPPPDKLKIGAHRHLVIAGKSQADLVMGTQGPLRKSPDYVAASLGNSVLGQFGMMGRIGESVREKSGLAYHASASLNAWIAGGSWEVSAGVNPANLEKAADLIRQELKRFVEEPVSVEELEDSQANFVGRLPLQMESNSGVANSILNLERFQLGLDYYRTYAERVRQVTPTDILESARKHLDLNALAVVSAGPEN